MTNMTTEHKYICLHCDYDHIYSGVVRGKIQTNRSDGRSNPIYKDCPACDGAGYISDVIMDSLNRYCKQHTVSIDELMGLLKNSSDHFCFWINGMYHGVEFTGTNRGYIHT
jgi:hypothetical protein